MTFNTESISERLSHINSEALGIPGQGTIVSMIVKKKGVVRGGKVHDDDTVHVVLWAGFHYKALVDRSAAKLQQMWDSGTLFKDLTAESAMLGMYAVKMPDVAVAVQEINRTLAPRHGASHVGEVDANNDKRWGPVAVNGENVIGARVYIGPPGAIKPGDIYISGVKLGEKVLETSENGKWEPTSSPVVSVKKLIRSKLPLGLYAQYILSPDRLVSFHVGEDAAVDAKKHGVAIDPLAVRSLFKIAV